MASKTITMTIKIKFAWWFKPYAYALIIWQHFGGRAPSEEHVKRMVERGATPYVVS